MKTTPLLAILFILILNQEYQLSDSKAEKDKININTTVIQNINTIGTAGYSGEYIDEYITEAQRLVQHYPNHELKEHFSFADIARDDRPADFFYPINKRFKKL